MPIELHSPGLEIDPTKYNTCSYRTEEKVTFFTKECCGKPSIPMLGHRCNLFAIDGITPTTCLNCKAYQNKDA